MDSYPEDLLVGVFPLVFAVNAILADNGNSSEGSLSPKRSTFERFLDAVAASLVDEDDDRNLETKRNLESKRSVSLFQQVDEDSSDDSDLEEFSGHRRKSNSLSAGIYPGFGRKSLVRSSSIGSEAKETSYAKALTHGQGFFQRARIETASARHAFPPSKDPEGTRNISQYIQNGLQSNNVEGLRILFQDHPLDGILPAGWLEKHVHALPSVILVVCSISGSQAEQDAQDKFLYETIEHLHYSLVPKRQCKIHLVGLMEESLSSYQGEEWSRAITRHSVEREGEAPAKEAPFRVTLLRVDDDLQSNDTGMPTSQALRQLHKGVRDASLSYYLGQARRGKKKLARLSKGKGWSIPERLLPLAIRYCFKVAMFYEFQWKHEKSLKFMSEAYRYVATYYKFLILIENTVKGGSITSPSHTFTSNVPVQSVAGTDDGVEVALTDGAPSYNTILAKVVRSPPDDMIHQCRAVADWTNFKLLSAGFVSHTEDGLLAAAEQWRHHARTFCTQRYSSSLRIPAWFECSYIAQQRLVVSELVERHPPVALGALGNEYDEVLLRCSPWKLHESGVEALLCLAREMDLQVCLDPERLDDESERSNIMRAPFVGGLGSDGLAPILRNERTVDHRRKAEELLLRAIALFEHELEKYKRGFYAEDEFSERTSCRTGARLYYLAGGIFLGTNRHEESLGFLEKAAKLSHGWRELELAVRRMLIECYEKHVPTHSETSESSQRLASMILDSYFNAEMSAVDLRRALNHFASVSGGESLKWYHDTTNEEDDELPFSFHVHFPENIFATIGGTVKASLLIRSNLDYAIHVNSVTLTSLAGELPIPIGDLLSATNVIEGVEGTGIIIQRRGEIAISTEFELPKDLSAIVADDSGNGGETLGTAGRGSFAKSARPRTAGVTSAGGARLVSEDQLSRGNDRSQGWSLRFLGGRPLRCDGLQLVFYPVQAEKIAGGSLSVTLIELLMEKKKPKTAANIKRTAFEEENYIASAWARPQHISFTDGPRSIRVLGPQPELVVTDLTNPYTDGKALEGTVNRVILKLEAGSSEICSNLKFRVTCFSVFVSNSGVTKRLVSARELNKDPDSGIDMKDPSARTPVLVVASTVTYTPETTDYGYTIPSGWALADAGQGYSGTQLPSIKKGECTFMPLNFYRPAASIDHNDALFEVNSTNEGRNRDAMHCRTDFYVTVSYRQQRPRSQKQKQRGRRISRKLPVMSASKAQADDVDSTLPARKVTLEPGIDFERKSYEEVTLEYSGSVVWARPVVASFSRGGTRAFPSGSRHPANAVDAQGDCAPDEFSLIDGECVGAICTLQTDNAVPGLKTEIISVKFVEESKEDSPLTISLRQNDKARHNGELYQAVPRDVWRILNSYSKFSVAFSARVSLHSDYSNGGITAPLGALVVDWRPVPLALPSDAKDDISVCGDVAGHGPMCLTTPSTICFAGPQCYVESAPFEVTIDALPSIARIGEAFDVIYNVCNKTLAQQPMSIHAEVDSESSCLFDNTIILGEICLAPGEVYSLTYRIVATRAGDMPLPDLAISSVRYGSWIVKSSDTARRRVFAFP